MLVLLGIVLTQCPPSCRPSSGRGCLPPRCGPKCCQYWARKKVSLLPPSLTGSTGSGALANASQLPTWVERCQAREQLESPSTCASSWVAMRKASVLSASPASNRLSSSEPSVLLVSLFKNARAEDMVRFVEYHLLMGIDHAVLVDNSCGAHAERSSQALAPYVSAGLVTLLTQFQCTELRSMMFMSNFRGGSSMARQLGRLDHFASKGSLIVALDDDEYLVLPEIRDTLRTLRRELVARRVCALTVTWRVFGSSGHRCQPRGPLIRRFIRRAATELEMRYRRRSSAAAARHEAKMRHLNTPYGGKPIYIYSGPASPQCGTHWCTECTPGLVNCAATETGPTAYCERRYNLSARRLWINHYAFQSAAHWEQKKARGRTNLLPPRVGGVPPSYDRVVDQYAIELLARRIANVAHAPLRNCLSDLFG